MSDLLGGVPVTARSGRCAMSIGGSQQIAANRSRQANCQRPIECTLGIDATQCDAILHVAQGTGKGTGKKIPHERREHEDVPAIHSCPAAGHSTFFL